MTRHAEAMHIGHGDAVRGKKGDNFLISGVTAHDAVFGLFGPFCQSGVQIDLLADMHDAALDGDGDGVRAVVGAEFG